MADYSNVFMASNAVNGEKDFAKGEIKLNPAVFTKEKPGMTNFSIMF